MSWEKHFKKYDFKQEIQKSFQQNKMFSGGSPYDVKNTRAGVGTGSKFISYLPEYYAGDPQRVQRYGQYEAMDRDPEIYSSLNVIADFCTQTEDRLNSNIFDIKFKAQPTPHESKILTSVLEEWIELNDFERKIWYIFRNIIKFGDQFFVRDPSTFEWLWIDPAKVDKVLVDESKGKKPQQYIVNDFDLNLEGKSVTKPVEYTATVPLTSAVPRPSTPYNTTNYTVQPGTTSRFNQSYNSTAIDAAHIIHLSLNVGMDSYWPFGASILEPVYKTFKQKELLEDAVIIYRVQRAPERRVFYIDTGDMPPNKAAQHIEKVRNDLYQRRIPSRNNGNNNITDAAYNPMSILDDFFLATSGTGRSSKIETLPGGENLGQIDDLKYFNNKLIRGMGVPAIYISTGPDDSAMTYNDGRVGTAYIQEFKFARFCMRLQNIVAPIFDNEFKLYVKEKGYSVDESLYSLQFHPPQNFTKYAQIERDAAQVNVFTSLQDVHWLSKRFLQKRYLGLSDQEINENMLLWAEEHASLIKDATGVEPSEMEGNDDMGSMGIRDNDFESTFDNELDSSFTDMTNPPEQEEESPI